VGFTIGLGKDDGRCEKTHLLLESTRFNRVGMLPRGRLIEWLLERIEKMLRLLCHSDTAVTYFID
jgi:hypothetical protein